MKEQKTEKNRKAVLYLRSAAQSHDGLERQEATLRGYASDHGLEIVAVYAHEDASEDVGKLLSDIAANSPEATDLLVESIERLSRYMCALKAAQTIDVNVHIVREKLVLPAGAPLDDHLAQVLPVFMGDRRRVVHGQKVRTAMMQKRGA